MRKKSLLVVAVCAAAVTGFNISAASAQGQVEQGPDHARSICSFSGLNDEPDAAFPEGGRVQSYGQLVRQGVVTPGAPTPQNVESPGFLCNPNNLSLK